MTSRAEILESHPQPRNRSLAFGGTFVLLAALPALVAFVPYMAHVALSACYLGVFLAYLGLRSDPQGGYLFEVIVPLGVLSFFYFGVGTLYLLIVPDALDYTALEPFLLPAQALLTLGFVCFLAGYGSFFRRTAPSPLGRLAPRNPFLYLVPSALGAAGMCMQKFQAEGMLRDRGISPALSFLQQFGPLFFFGWFLAWYMLWSRRLRPLVAIMVLASLSAMALVVLTFTFGGKGLAATLIGLPAVAYYEVKRKVPWKSVVIVALIFVFIIFPMYNNFRQLDKNLDVSRRVDRAVSMTKSWTSDRYFDASIFAFMKRTTIVTSVAAIVSDTGRWVEYRYGETLILAPIGLLIPRFLWPEKPDISIGREFGATFRLTNVMDRETYVSPSIAGDFYWNFGVPGVVIGMYLLGMGYRWYYQRYGAGGGFDPLRKAIYWTLMPTAISFEGNVSFVVAACVKTLVILVGFLILTRRMGWLTDTAQS